MKKTILTTLVLMIITATFTFGSNPVRDTKIDKRSAAIVNLIDGLESENTGLQVSSAYYLGEYESTEAVVPLMKLFNNNSNESVRIAAALSLMKINDARGIKLIKYAGENDGSLKVMKLCKKFYAYAMNEK